MPQGGPKTSQRRGGDNKLIPLNPSNNPLSWFDDACTGTNDTWQTSQLYLTIAQLAANQTPVAAQPCLMQGVTPIPFVNASSWHGYGCQAGFYCPNNSINALPQYCTPSLECFATRLGGDDCGVKQGVFEPLSCPAGSYCPPGGKQLLTCPQGYFCPPGTVDPMPCAAGANCPAGSTYQMSWLPLIALIVLDVVLIAAQIVARFVANRTTHRGSPKSGMVEYLRRASEVRLRSRTNSAVSIEEDTEVAVALESRIQTVKRQRSMLLDPDSGWAYDDGSYANSDAEVDEKHPHLQAFVTSLNKVIQSSAFGLTFTFTHLTYQPKGVAKPILSSVSGQIGAGQLCAIMGGSGAGKSTLVNVLMGKRPNTGGTIKINGVAGKVSTFKNMIGYVPQDDVLIPELTVRENILHSARCRLPSRWQDKQIQDHVDTLIKVLKVDHIKDSLVGSVAKPVISGGQRKRVSIGMELAAAPMALFLDEPTSGLDATAAASLMDTLKALSSLGITVVVIIHQPRQEIFGLFDDLILLGSGQLIYAGPTNDAQHYLADQCGYHFPSHANPADVLMDIVNGEGRLYKRAGDTSLISLVEQWTNRQNSTTTHTPILEPPSSEIVELRRSARRRGATRPAQFYYCLLRTLLQQYRLVSSFWFEMGVSAVGGFLVGLAENGQHGVNFHGYYLKEYSVLSSSIDYGSLPQLSLQVAISIGLIAAAPGFKVFGEEKLTYYREAAAGHSRLGYYVAKVLGTFPRMLLGCLHFTTLFILLATPQMTWLASFAANLLYFYAIYGLASIVSMCARREDGPLLAVMASLIVGTLSGMAPTIRQVDSWGLGWLWRLSPGTWMGEAYFDTNVSPWAALYQVDNAAQATGYRLGAYGRDLGMLLLLGTAYRVLAFVGMRFLFPSRQK